MAASSSNRRAGAARAGSFRAHARRNVRLRALVTHVQAGWQRSVAVENLGLGGARLAIAGDVALAEGDAVTVSFTAPTLWDPLVLRARAAWVQPPGPGGALCRAGVAFEHKSKEAAMALYELIMTLAYD